MSIYYKDATHGTKMVVLSYVDDSVYWYASEYLGKWFVDTQGNRFHVNFLGCVHWFMSISISQMNDHSILVDKARYSNYIVDTYLDTSTVNNSSRFYKPICHIILYSPMMMHLPTIMKLRGLLGPSIFTIDIVLYHRFICHILE